MSERHFEVVLPVGAVGDDGRVRKDAAIRKMRGHEEALLYETSLTSAELVTELLRGCLVRLGDETEISKAQVDRMYSADRTFLLVAIRRVTLGDRVRASYPCAGCGGEMPIEDDLSKLPIRTLDGDRPPPATPVELEDGYTDRDGVRHASLWLRLPRGTDEALVASTAPRDPLRARDALVLRCIESFGSLPRAALESYGIKILRDLTLGDRRRILAALDAAAPGLDLRRPIRCPHCNHSSQVVLEVSHFFEDG